MLAHAMLPCAVVRCEPGPNYRDEVCAPGRQGIRAKRDTNPARGSAYLLWDHAPRLFPGAGALSRFLALSRGRAAWRVQYTHLTRWVQSLSRSKTLALPGRQ